MLARDALVPEPTPRGRLTPLRRDTPRTRVEPPTVRRTWVWTPALLLSAVLAAAGGCGGDRAPQEPAGEATAPATADPEGPIPYGARDRRPRLVIAVVFEGLSSDVFERVRPHLPARGLLQRAISEGMVHPRAVFPFAASGPATGHAALHTGASPRRSGIVAEWVRHVHGLADDAQVVVESPYATEAGPRSDVLAVQTVADLAHSVSAGSAQIVAVGMHPSAVIPAAGHGAGLAIWYDPDRQRPGFRTSAEYADPPPSWLTEWDARHDVTERLAADGGEWRPHDRGLLSRLAGADDAPGEGDLYGLGTTFPHRTADAEDPTHAFLLTPASTQALLGVAAEAARATRMGVDDVADLLTISVGATGYAGQVYGPESWEFLDNLVVADLLMAELVQMLASRGPVAVVIAGSNGLAPRTESTTGGARVVAEQLRRRADDNIDQRMGRRIQWIERIVPPYAYMTRGAPFLMDEAVTAAVAALNDQPEVARAYAVADVDDETEGGDAIDMLVRESIHRERDGRGDPRGGEIFLVMRDDIIFDAEHPTGYGSNTGSAAAHDRTVPVLMVGAGISQGEGEAELDARQVASTLSRLLGVPRPIEARSAPIPGATRAR